SLQFLLDT
nr:Chain G, uba3-derived peptide [Homo sapiens]5JJM_H Chain H, uba3-derived peptide [Homo sapiens]5JJM_I Chain I, uba3-derived peptide [Homo sapiens]5JJM_J Chain J, uba3-derived peptide [Homo sapiens]